MSKNIVLLHGWGASAEKLEGLKKELEALRWNVFVPELPGFETAPPNRVWGLDNYADYVLKKADNNFKSGYFIFGHSFGGGISIKVALRSGTKLQGIVLCATRGFSRGSLVKRIIFFILAKLGKVLILFSPVAYFWKKILYKLAREHDYEKTKGIMRDVFKKIIAEDLKDKVCKIKVPALVLWGEEDKMTPIKDAVFIKNNLPGAILVTFKNIGHRLPYERQKDVAINIEKWYKLIK